MSKRGKELKFFIKCHPPKATWQSGLTILYKFIARKKIPFIGTPNAHPASSAKKYLALLLKQHKPSTPMRPPLCLHVDYVYTYPKSYPKSYHGKLMRCSKRPDNSNLIKILEDAMEDARFFEDDAHVSCSIFNRYYCDTPGIGITLTELSEFVE